MNTETSEPMASSSVLPENIKQILANANLSSAKAIFTTSYLTLEKLGLSPDDQRAIRRHFGIISCPGFVTASQCAAHFPHKWQKITFGCTALDQLTQNGLETRGVTEIAGGAGTGKSQMCMQLALMVQLPRSMGGLDKGAVFICTEDPFASSRLFQMVEAVHSLYGSRVRGIPFASRIFIEHLTDVPSLLKCVRVNLPKLLHEHDVGLVVIDSVGAIFRLETSDTYLRALDMRELVFGLLGLSNRYGCAVVCVNQVTSVIQDTEEEQLVPCLGLAWANLVSTRIQLHRTAKSVSTNQNSDDETIVRRMEIIFSPNLAPSSAEFLITADGVTDVPEYN